MAKRNMFVGMDVHKESIFRWPMDDRQGEVRHYGVIPGDLEGWIAEQRLCSNGDGLEPGVARAARRVIECRCFCAGG